MNNVERLKGFTQPKGASRCRPASDTTFFLSTGAGVVGLNEDLRIEGLGGGLIAPVSASARPRKHISSLRRGRAYGNDRHPALARGVAARARGRAGEPARGRDWALAARRSFWALLSIMIGESRGESRSGNTFVKSGPSTNSLDLKPSRRHDSVGEIRCRRPRRAVLQGRSSSNRVTSVHR